jgi:hypothetical protein
MLPGVNHPMCRYDSHVRSRPLPLLAAMLIFAFLTIYGCGSGSSTYSPLVGGAEKVTKPASFSISVSPPTDTIFVGGSATFTVTLKSINGFRSTVTPQVSGLPAGASAQFSSTSVVPTEEGMTTTLTVNTTAAGEIVTPPGSSTLNISANGGGVTQATSAQMKVNLAPSFTVSVSPPSVTVFQGQAASYTVTVTAVNGFIGTVTPSITGLPSGALGQFTSNSITPSTNGTTTTLTVSTTGPGDGVTPAASTTFTVNGTSGGAVKSGMAQITVQAPGSLAGTIQ